MHRDNTPAMPYALNRNFSIAAADFEATSKSAEIQTYGLTKQLHTPRGSQISDDELVSPLHFQVNSFLNSLEAHTTDEASNLIKTLQATRAKLKTSRQ